MPVATVGRRSKQGRRLSRQTIPPPPPPDNHSEPEPEQPMSYSDWLLDSILSFDKFAPRLLRIQTKSGDLVPFQLNKVQELLEEIRKDVLSKNRLIRFVVLKARREGVSTWVSGRFYWKTITNRNRYSMIICHEPEATDFVFKMHKRFQDHIPPEVRPTERYNNKKMLEFNNETATGLDSAIRVGTAGKEDFGSAQLIHYLHLSELAKYPRHTVSNLLTSLLQCLPDNPDTEIYMESTAKGVGGEFYARYWKCRYTYEFYLEGGEVKYREVIREDSDASNEYTAIFIPWFVFDEYTRPVPEGFALTDKEKEIKDRYGLSDGQMAWRRWTIENKCDGDVDIFNQEYPDNPMDAFISASDNCFDTRMCQTRMALCKPAPKRYEVQQATGHWIIAEPKTKNPVLQVWDEPVPGHEYVLSCDTAEGLPTGDFSSVDVIDCLTRRQVAHYQGKVHPEELAMFNIWVCKRYNNATAAIERNMHGLSVIDTMQRLGYNKIYFEMVAEMPPMKPRKRFGFVTTKHSKPLIVDNLAAEFRQGIDGIQCRETINEMMTFKKFEDQTMGAEEGFYDDRVMSYAIGKFVLTKIPKYNKVNKIDNQAKYYYNNQIKPVGPSITPESWT